jgi:hypothetical protein
MISYTIQVFFHVKASSLLKMDQCELDYCYHKGLLCITKRKSYER